MISNVAAKMLQLSIMAIAYQNMETVILTKALTHDHA